MITFTTRARFAITSVLSETPGLLTASCAGVNSNAFALPFSAATQCAAVTTIFGLITTAEQRGMRGFCRTMSATTRVSPSALSPPETAFEEVAGMANATTAATTHTRGMTRSRGTKGSPN